MAAPGGLRAGRPASSSSASPRPTGPASMTNPSLLPAGYMLKRVAARPDWLVAPGVDDIYSVSGCISADFADYIGHWRHNGFWLFDNPRPMVAIATAEDIDSPVSPSSITSCSRRPSTRTRAPGRPLPPIRPSSRRSSRRHRRRSPATTSRPSRRTTRQNARRSPATTLPAGRRSTAIACSRASMRPARRSMPAFSTGASRDRSASSRSIGSAP